MTGGPTYVLDANVFIEAARRYYAFDLVPPFWTKLAELASDGRVQSIDHVRKELERGKDELAKWAKEHFDHGFVSTDEDDVIRSYGEIMVWAQRQNQFSDAAKAEFADGADGWLIAYARTKGHVVVTHEQLAPDAKSTIKIPNACQAFRVLHVDTFKMLRDLGVRFA